MFTWLTELIFGVEPIKKELQRFKKSANQLAELEKIRCLRELQDELQRVIKDKSEVLYPSSDED